MASRLGRIEVTIIEDKAMTQKLAKEIAEGSTPAIEGEVNKVFNEHAVRVQELMAAYDGYLSLRAIEVRDQLYQQAFDFSTQPVNETPATVIKKILEKKDSFSKSLRKFLDILRKWGVSGYKEILTFRQFMTGKSLHYSLNFEGADKGRYVQQVSEEDFIQMISNSPLESRDGWVVKSDDGPDKMADLFDMQKLSVKFDFKKGEDLRTRLLSGAISVSNDALYQYLYAQYSHATPTIGKPELLQDARRFELYDHLKFTVFSYLHNGKSGFYSITQDDLNAHIGEVDKTIQDYFDAKMHKDTIAFYRTGDTIDTVLQEMYENKLEGGVVSIRTIKNALKRLRDLFKKRVTVSEMARRLTNILAYTDTKHGYAASIQDEVYRISKEAILEKVKQLNLDK